jgi:sn-glycerol 3-phosphate transport system substrate-binding protein
MHRRTLLAASAAVAAAPLIRPAHAQAAKTRIVWWHAMTAALDQEVHRLADAFNASQTEVEVTPIYNRSTRVATPMC